MSELKKIPSGVKLWRQVLSDYRLHFWRYTFIVLVVIIPVTILNEIALGDATVSAYGSLATLFMNTALIYAIFQFNASSSKPTFRSLYYDSSKVMLRYIIVGVILALMLIPAALGLGIIGLGGNAGGAPALGELLLLGIIGLFISLPSIYLMVRNGLGLITVYTDDLWPSKALKRSRELTAGRFWQVLGRYALLILGLLVAILPLSVLLIGLFVVTQASIFLSVYQILNTAVILPLLYLYLYKLHNSLVSNNNLAK